MIVCIKLRFAILHRQHSCGHHAVRLDSAVCAELLVVLLTAVGVYPASADTSPLGHDVWRFSADQ